VSHVLTIDFETYYDRDFSLTKYTTEEYIRHPMFEVIGVAVQIDNGDPEWFSGSHNEIQQFLLQFNWQDSLALAHNAMFDAAILNWIFNISPKGWLDTLSMARPLDGVDAGGSLKALAERYDLGEKGTEVINAMGKRRALFDPYDLAKYGEYCKNDVALTYKLFSIFKQRGFPVKELKLIDLTIKMFSQPVLMIDVPVLQQHLVEVVARKELLLKEAESNKEIIMSNDKFAAALTSLGVEPPRKKSPRTGKMTWAFSKVDEEFKALLEHPKEEVQNLVAARLGVKTTLEETRTERFISIGKRGPLPVPLKYYAAHTGRWGGSDKVNLQNLPARDGKSMIKKAIVPPSGFTLIDSDSSQIEARTLAWLAGQQDLVEAFANGEDVYKIMAGKIYDKPAEEVTKDERFFGKTVILGAGYGMGAKKFHLMLRLQGVNISESEAERIITIYRSTYPRIATLWTQGNEALNAMLTGSQVNFGRAGVVKVVKNGFTLPSNLSLLYNNLSVRTEGLPNGGSRNVYTYDSRREKGIYIYGGKVVENVVQALARCIIGEQMLLIAKQHRVVLTVHDAIMCVVPDEKVEVAQAYIKWCMTRVPEWGEGLPINCEVGVGKTYGDC
jgi:DNA polymerase I-like protein with 3'-5' exonuclease and polymerase domains